jgi:transcriptional regulator GlxA family with amidase domain
MIGVLIFPDFQLLDAAGPISVFEIAARFAGKPPSIKVIAVTPGRCAVRPASRCWRAAKTARRDHDPDRGGRRGRRAARHAKTLAFVRAMAKRGVRIASVCSGAYILPKPACSTAAAPPRIGSAPAFSQNLSEGEAGADRIFVRDGNVWSSAGITPASIWRWRWSRRISATRSRSKTARQLVLYHRRSGGQSQFSSLLELKAPNGRFAPLLTWAREHLDAPLTVETGRAGRHERAAFYPRLHRRDRHHAVEGGGAAAHRGGAAARAVLPRRSSASRDRPAFAIRSGCAAPSSAPSASRRNRCAARRGRGSAPSAKPRRFRAYFATLACGSSLPMVKKPWNWPG